MVKKSFLGSNGIPEFKRKWQPLFTKAQTEGQRVEYHNLPVLITARKLNNGVIKMTGKEKHLPVNIITDPQTAAGWKEF